MAKIIAWLIVVFVVLLALRIVNLRHARARRASESARQGGDAKAGNVAEPMVRCARCGVYLPRAEATSVRDGYACAVGECAKHA
jgi:uncharacterized protein